MDVHVAEVPWSTHGDRLRRVREIVFIEEQSVPRDEEWDGRDADATHFIALNAAGQALGCARLLPDGQIGRMAVLAAHRGMGLGLRLLQAAVEAATRRGLRTVFLHAQTHALGFYRKAGFLPRGPEFMEAGIPHVEMELALPVSFEPLADVARPVVRPQSAPKREEPPLLVEDDGENACIAGFLACLARCRRSLNLLSPLLDPLLFDRPDVVETISAIARDARNFRMQILIRDSSLIVARGHRLVELARRLDSRLVIRRLPGDAATEDLAFATWDGRGYWLQPDSRVYQAQRNFDDPVQARRFTERFERLWSRSAPDPELRLLRL